MVSSGKEEEIRVIILLRRSKNINVFQKNDTLDTQPRIYGASKHFLDTQTIHARYTNKYTIEADVY